MIERTNSQTNFIRDFYAGTIKANDLLKQYCKILYQQFGSYQEVARRTGLDRRTVKKYLQS